MSNGGRDRWDKAEILLKPSGALMGAITVAIVGWLAQGYLQERQTNETKTQLYTQLISQREQAESQLRSDMFSKIIDRFWGQDTLKSSEHLEYKVLSLELLAQNFHESMNVKPLFMHLKRNLPGQEDSAAFLDRMYRVAREVKYRQVGALEVHGGSRDVDLRLPKRSDAPDSTYAFKPVDLLVVTETDAKKPDTTDLHFFLGVKGFILSDRSLKVTLEPVDPSDTTQNSSQPEDSESGGDQDAGSSLQRDTLYVDIGDSDSATGPPSSWDYPESGKPDEVQEPPAPASGKDKSKPFSVGWFDFPMIDNTRLGGEKDLRVAVVLSDWDEDDDDDSVVVKLKVLGFPGSYAGLREKPFYDDIVKRLIKSPDEEEI